MQNLDAYFKDKGFLEPEGRAALLEHCDRNLVRLTMSERRPHLGILHYREDVMFGKGEWTDFSKSCRGVVLDFHHRRVVTKPFRKFFNLGERFAPSLRDLEGRRFRAAEKLDGSMIMTFHDELGDQFVTTTKGHLDSEQGAWAMDHIPPSVKDRRLLRDHTLVWEMVSRKHQIVIPYAKKGYEEGLYLIGVRHNASEKLFSLDEVREFAVERGLRTFKTYDFPSLESILDDAKTLPFTEEGYVIRFDGDELMVKVKSAEYLRIHRFIGNLSTGNLLDILIDEKEQQVYDNLGFVPEEYRDDVEAQMRGFQREALEFRDACYATFATLPLGDRKPFALALKAMRVGEREPFVFKLFDGRHPQLTDIYKVFRKR